MLTPEQRTLRARLAAHTLHSQRDPRETTAAARQARWDRYLDQVDPDRQLSETERTRRAKAARSADMTRLALKSSVVRAQRRTTGDTAA
ncbi:hypothetical protein K6U06_19815 [Acidiferrimicrobium sp. IK]|uniref:hypothetical protein n=1 Tax=Acidiferrimicrobium sp. IK TaxID=2871700 RepID=UPI0021CB17B4|nr:hypothetical protein [Acidiferrimicrobium sp. IK]MCU4186622.1 hypothetical protein [Acidiferrimicrobium sp. IK]